MMIEKPMIAFADKSRNMWRVCAGNCRTSGLGDVPATNCPTIDIGSMTEARQQKIFRKFDFNITDDIVPRMIAEFVKHGAKLI